MNRKALLHAQFEAQSAGASWSVLASEGGWYSILRLPNERNEEATCLSLVERGVLVQPGHFYELPGGPHLVLSLLPPGDVFAEGIRLLTEALRS
jgi:hypothetical protein